MSNPAKYLYGPVPSRRLGRSLGVDIVPFKTCTLDCVYCQLGKTTCKTIQRKDYVAVEAVLAELKSRLDAGLLVSVEAETGIIQEPARRAVAGLADYITIGGSGEPTLHSGLGRLIRGIKKLTSIPVAVLTNGTLFYLPQVRADCAEADVILPSLDAGDEAAFDKINRPIAGITFDRLVEGLRALRNEFAGQIWLEVFCIERFNTDSPQIARLAEAIQSIRPDKVHLNTAVRPTSEQGIEKIPPDELLGIARQIGPNCEVIADYLSSHCGKATTAIEQILISMLKRRPCTLDDVCSAMGVAAAEATAYLDGLAWQGKIRSENKAGRTFFTAR